MITVALGAGLGGVVRQTGFTYDLGRDATGEVFSAFGGFGMPTTRCRPTCRS